MARNTMTEPNYSLNSVTFEHTTSEGLTATVTVDWQRNISGAETLKATSEHWSVESSRILAAASRHGLALFG